MAHNSTGNRTFMRNTDVKDQISKFMKSPYILDRQKLSIDDAIDSFNGIIYTACAKSLKKIENKYNTRKKAKTKKGLTMICLN